MLKITHGPHIGRINSHGARIWFRLDQEGYARVLYSPGSPFNTEISEEELSEKFKRNKTQLEHKEAKKENDYIITIDIKGLEVDTEYIYVVEVSNDGENYFEQPIAGRSFGYFKTFPGNGNLQEELVFAFGSCFQPHMEGDQIFEGLDKKSQEEKGFHFLLLIGDQIYADYMPKKHIKKNSGEWKKCLPIIFKFIPVIHYFFIFKEAVDFEAFKYVYRSFWASIPFRHALMRIPTFMTLDDHEFRNGWGSRGENRKPERSKIYKRRNAALSAYDLYQQTLNPQTPEKQYWYHFNFCDIGFFVLDTRTERDKEAGEILDGNQMQALKDWLNNENENYKLKFIVSSVPIVHIAFPRIVDWLFDWLLPADGGDQWPRFKKQRKELINFIFDKDIQGVHFLSGDVHLSHISKITKEGKKNKDIFSFTSSPFAVKSSKLHAYISLKDDLWKDDSGNKLNLIPIFKGAGKNFGVVRISPPQNNNNTNHPYNVSFELYDKCAEQFFKYPSNALIVLDVDRTLSSSRMLKKGSTPYPSAPAVVNQLHKRFGVIYLTASNRVSLVRHWLRENGFPVSQIMIRSEMINQMEKRIHSPLIGIGDSKTYAKVFKENVMISLIIQKDNSSDLSNKDVYIIKPGSELPIWVQIEDIIFNRVTLGREREEGIKKVS